MTTTYKDLTRGCLQTAEKLYLAARPNAPRYPWRLELSGQTAGIMFGPNPFNHAQQWTLNLPSIALDARMTARERDLWAGYTIHETGHACFTDFAVWQIAIREGLQDLVNALEDVRIERQTIASGVAANAQGLLETLATYMLGKALAQGFDPAQKQGFAFGLAIYGRAIVGEYTLKDLPALPPAIAKSWAWIWPELSACQSTQDVLALARKISRKQKAAENRAQKSQQAQAPEGEEEAPPQGAQGAGPEGEDKPEEEAPAQPPQRARRSKKQNAQPPQPAQAAFGAADVEPDLRDIARAINERMGKDEGDLRTDETLGTIVPPRVMPIDVSQDGRPDMVSRLEKVYPSLSKLKADLQRLVRSPDRIAITRGQTAGRLDRRAYGRALTGAADVFARRSYAEGVNAAVSIVLDVSSSMDEKGKLTYSNAMALAMGDALDRAGVSFEIIAAGLAGHVEAGGARVELFKPFNAAWRKQRALLGRLKTYPGTANLVGSDFAVSRLLTQRDATRRLLFVLSDGDDYFRHGSRAWRRSIDLWAKQGVETIGVGLLHDVSPYFPDCVNIYDPADLAREGLGIITRRLKIAA